MMVLSYFLIALVLILRSNANCQDDIIQTPEEVALMDHLVKHGSMFKLKTGKKCPTCVRGAFATQDFKEGDLIAAMPLSLGVPLLLDFHGYPAEFAHEMVQRMMLDPEFNKTYGIYWDTLPRKGEILSAETFTREHIAMFHAPELERLAELHRNISEDAYYGRTEGFKPIPELLGGDAAMDLSDFLHVAALVGSRDFTTDSKIPLNVTIRTLDGQYEQRDMRKWLLPVIDIINHHHYPNALRSNNETHLLETALRDIKKGEELFNSYQKILHRNDMSLLLYGFIFDESLDRILASDLPDFDKGFPWKITPMEDSYYYGPGGYYNTLHELERLNGLVKQAESITTTEQDAMLLEEMEAKGGYDWKKHMIIKFRLGRKRTLKRAIKLVEAELEDEYEDDDAIRDEL